MQPSPHNVNINNTKTPFPVETVQYFRGKGANAQAIYLFKESSPYTSIIIGKIIGLRRVCSYKKRPSESFTLVLSDAHSFTFSLIKR